VFGDADLLYALARSQAGLGMFAEAQTTLRVVAARIPGAAKSTEFLNTVHEVFERQKAAGVSGRHATEREQR
jgi:hypothetical protein